MVGCEVVAARDRQDRLFEEEIPRLSVESPDLIKRMRAELPVVITGTRLVEAATARWTVEYWAAEAGDHNSFHVNLAPSLFLYSDLDNNPGKCVVLSCCKALAVIRVPG